MKAAQEEQWAALQRIEQQVAFYDDSFRFGDRGEDHMEKKEVTFQREELYEEIWKISLSKVAKKYDVPYQKLKDACTAAKIPLPSQSYWGNIYMGKAVETEPLPESSQTTVTVQYSVRTISPAPTISQTRLQPHMDEKTPLQNEETAVTSETAEAVIAPPKSNDGRNLYERKVLYEEVWKAPVTEVAKHYGVSDVMIHKVCKTLNVPVPPRGYWAKKSAGQPVKQEPLSEHTGMTAVFGKKQENDKRGSTRPLDESLSFLDDEERLRVIETALQLKVDPQR